MKSVVRKLLVDKNGKAKHRAQPRWVAPMLATLTEERFTDPAWIFEKKLDGQRVLAFKNGKSVRLLSRNQLELNSTYPELVKEISTQKKSFILDGEVVAFDHGSTSFAMLQQRMKVAHATTSLQSRVPIYYFVFDLLHLDGYDLSQVPLITRKQLLSQAIQFGKHVRFTEHVAMDGEKYYELACREQWEGIIAKRADSEYVSRRSPDWQKWKCVLEQEFVIGGYTDPAGQRTGFGALLVGYYDGDTLRYAGKVGTGYSGETLRSLTRTMRALKRDKPALTGTGLPRKGVHWIDPKLVAQIGFTEWTTDGKLRHPRFLGLRNDKAPREVVRE